MADRIIVPSTKIDKGERFHHAGEGVPLCDDQPGRLAQAMGSQLWHTQPKRAPFPVDRLDNDGSYYSADSMSFGGTGTDNFLCRNAKSYQ